MCLKGLLLVHVRAEDFVHNLLGVHLTGTLSSELFPGSSASQGGVSFDQELQDLLVRTGFSAHADLVADLLVAGVAGSNRAVEAVSVLGADLADVIGSGDRKVSTEVCWAFRDASVAEGRTLELQVVVDEGSAEDHKAERNKAE